jgi:predicted 3-demethylubiquinone-9 3-methyltransferase (glyoxalase superfamily)
MASKDRRSVTAKASASTIAPSKIVPHLWFAEKAVEAARFYVSLFPDSQVDSVTDVPAETPSGPPGSVHVVEFTLAGQPFMAIDAGPLDPFNHAISFVVNCADQAEIDRLWDALSAGGSVEQCGWLKDRYGVSWQIQPAALGDMMRDPDRSRAGRVMEALLRMKKLDLAELRRAYGAGDVERSAEGGARREAPSHPST